MARTPFKAAGLMGLTAIPKMEGPVAAAQTYIRGAVLINNGSGELEEAGADPTDIVGVSLAKNPPTNNTSETGYFTPAYSNMVFEGTVDLSGAIDTGTTAATDVWTAYGITEDASGVWYVDKTKTATADARVRIIKLLDAAGTLNGRVRFQFLPIVDVAVASVAVTVWGSN